MKPMAGGANAVQQYMKAGLLDEIQIHYCRNTNALSVELDF